MTSPIDRFRRLSLATSVVTLVLVGIGGLVRATGSGLGCLDSWPSCAGGWVAPANAQGLIEYSHRAAAGVVVLLVIATAIAAFRWVARGRGLRAWSVTAIGVVLVQAWLGRIVVVEELHAAKVTVHFLVGMALVAVTTWVAAAARVYGRPPATATQRRVAGMTAGALAGTVLLLAVGAYVREKGAGLAFPDWPLMDGALVPALDTTPRLVHFVHRVLAALVTAHVGALALSARRDDRAEVRVLAPLAFAVFVAQVGLGGANVFTDLAPWAVLGHVAGGALAWAVLVALFVFARHGTPPVPDDGPVPRGHGVTDRVVAYVRLTKPRIVVLLLVTTVPAMVLAQRGWPPLGLIAATVLGGMLTSGSANAINQFLERDIDEKMTRTRKRPLPSHTVRPGRALVFGVALGAIGTTWLAVIVNPLAAALAAAAIGFYVFVYTVWLKRSTPQNIVIGGAAGAAPVLVGWAAVTGTVAAPAWVLFGIIFLWTPPHFWALAMRYREDYAAAGVPMMPVVRGDAETTKQILLYALALVAVTLLLVPVGSLGLLYAAAAAGLGGWFLYRAVRLRMDPTSGSAMRLFRCSVNYLGLLFAAIAADRLIV